MTTPSNYGSSGHCDEETGTLLGQTVQIDDAERSELDVKEALATKYDEVREIINSSELDTMSIEQILTAVKYIPIWSRVIISWQTFFVTIAYIGSFMYANPVILHSTVIGLMTSFTTFLVVTYFSYALKRYYDMYFLIMAISGYLSNFQIMTGAYMKDHKDIRDKFMRHCYCIFVIALTSLRQNEELTVETCLIPLNKKHNFLEKQEYNALKTFDLKGYDGAYLCIQWILEDYEEFLSTSKERNVANADSYNMYTTIYNLREKVGLIYDMCNRPIHLYFMLIVRAALLILFTVFACFVGSHHGNGDHYSANDLNAEDGNSQSPILNSLLFITVYVLLNYILEYSRDIEQPFGNDIEDFPIKLWLDKKITSCKKFHQVQDNLEKTSLTVTDVTDSDMVSPILASA